MPFTSMTCAKSSVGQHPPFCRHEELDPSSKTTHPQHPTWYEHSLSSCTIAPRADVLLSTTSTRRLSGLISMVGAAAPAPGCILCYVHMLVWVSVA